MGSPDPTTRAALVADHLRRLESQLDRIRVAVASLQRLLQPERAQVQVELRAVPATTDAVVPERSGRPGGLYDNALFEAGYRPSAEPPCIGRVHPATLPAVELAVTTHLGEHHDIDVSYGQLGSWVVDNALAVAGPVREIYLVGPRDTTEPAAWRTEIGWPVFRVSMGGSSHLTPPVHSRTSSRRPW